MKIKKSAIGALLVLLSCLLMAINPVGSKVVYGSTVEAAAKVAISAKKVNLYEKGKKVIALRKATSGKVQWSSSNKKVVRIKPKKNQCTLVARNAGRAAVKAKYKGKAYKCTVVVKKMKTQIRKKSVKEEGYIDISVFTPKGRISYKVMNPSIVRVVRTTSNSFRIYGLKEGTTDIVFSKGSSKIICRVVVEPFNRSGGVVNPPSSGGNDSGNIGGSNETETGSNETEKETEDSGNGGETEETGDGKPDKPPVDDDVMEGLYDIYGFETEGGSYNINRMFTASAKFFIGAGFTEKSAERVSLICDDDTIIVHEGILFHSETGNTYYSFGITPVRKGKYSVIVLYKDFSFVLSGEVLVEDPVQIEYEENLENMLSGKLNTPLVINDEEITDDNLRLLINLGVWLVDNRSHADDAGWGAEGVDVYNADYRKVIDKENPQNTVCTGYANIIVDAARLLGMKGSVIKASIGEFHELAEVEISGVKWGIDAGRAGLAGKRTLSVVNTKEKWGYYRRHDKNGITWLKVYE